MNRDFFIENRKNIINIIEDNSLIVLFSGDLVKKSADEKYSYSVNKNFYYLSGIEEKSIAIMLGKVNGNIIEKVFLKTPDLQMEKWVGKTLRKEEAISLSGVEDIDYVENLNSVIHRYICDQNVSTFYFDLEKDSFEDIHTKTELYALEIKSKYPQVTVKNIFGEISKLRSVKHPEEVEKIKNAIDITQKGIEFIMKKSKPDMKEYQLEAYFDFVCKTEGAKELAFKTIAASGINATILHYEKNDSIMKNNDLIMFDLGAKYEHYNADISRTFPINGKFTPRQREVYEAVLRVNEKIISEMKPGVNHSNIQLLARDLIAEECIKLGLITDKKDVVNYYWHGIGHPLGLDTHDVYYGKGIILKEGMVYTVEPGIYIEEENIGIRIEDDVVITKEGCENLSKNIIKTVEDIEKFMEEI